MIKAADCQCERCVIERAVTQEVHPIVGLIRMFVCQKCGNKRCPHATDHRNKCTESNEPGQRGSKYE